MTTVLQAAAALAILLGTFLSLVGVVGYLRFPDVYTRLHATGKVGVFGVALLLVAAILWTPLGWGRGLVLMAFMMIAGPVPAHAIASAAFRLGIPFAGSGRNDLTAQFPPAAQTGAPEENN